MLTSYLSLPQWATLVLGFLVCEACEVVGVSLLT